MNTMVLMKALESQIEDKNMCEIISAIILKSLSAVDPNKVVTNHLHREGTLLKVNGEWIDLEAYEKVLLISIGKAAYAMAAAAADSLGAYLTQGLVVQKNPTARADLQLPKVIQILQGGHPVPTDRSQQAGEQVLKLLQNRSEKDLVFFLISGGGSALITHPHPGISLKEIQILTQALLACGASIGEINTIRKHIDQVKGGALAKAAYPAKSISLVLSDVVGDPLDMIASGPTVPDTTTFANALAVITRYGLKDHCPPSIHRHLQHGVDGLLSETPKKDDPIFENTHALIIGSNLHAAQAGVNEAAAKGFNSQLLTTSLQGEARQAGQFLGRVTRQVAETGQPVNRPACLIAGGETTVQVRGDGLGGRNLEVALAAAMEIAGLKNVAFISLATDGEDGPTDAAGAVVTGETLQRALALNMKPESFLRNNDSYHFFEPLHALIKLGATGTNVNDLMFIFVY